MLSHEKQNVYLVDLGTGTDRNLLPLSIGLISSYCNSIPEINKTYNIDLRFARSAPRDLVESLDRPAVVGFACYQWNINASLTRAKLIKELYPDCLIVCGSYSIPSHPDRIKVFVERHPYVDILVHGEGELTFSDLLLSRIDGRSLEEVKGISFPTSKQPERFLSTPRREELIDLNDVPSPFLNGTFDKLMAQSGNKVTGAIWETNRGCPYACTFCAWGWTEKSKLRRIELDRLLKELDWISDKEIFYVGSADANFGILYERDLKIAEHLAKLCSKTGFPKHIQWSWAKNSNEKILHIADVLRKGGVASNTMISAQSFSTEALKSVKRSNISQDRFVELKQLYNERGLSTWTELILGLPGESYESFRGGLDQLMTYSLTDYFVVYLCIIIENAEMSDPDYMAQNEMETRLCSIGLERVSHDSETETEYEQIIVGTSSMPVEDWKRAYFLAYLSVVWLNFPLLSFVVSFLKREFNCQRTEVLEFFIEELSSNPDRYPQLNKGLEHLSYQRDQILAGKTKITCIPELNNVEFAPAEAMAYFLLKDPDQLFLDVQKIARSFCDANKLDVEDDLLMEIVQYQKARVPVWPVPESVRLQFGYNIPEYFDALIQGKEAPKICQKPMVVDVVFPEGLPEDPTEFVRQRIRGSVIMKTYEVKYTSTEVGAQIS